MTSYGLVKANLRPNPLDNCLWLLVHNPRFHRAMLSGDGSSVGFDERAPAREYTTSKLNIVRVSPATYQNTRNDREKRYIGDHLSK